MDQWIIPNDVPRDAILARAIDCGIEPVVRRALADHDVMAELRQTAQTALYWATLKTALTALDTIPAIVLKGAPLALWLYGDDRMRASTDVDLWIPKYDLDRAIRALQTVGYAPQPVIRPWATNQVVLTHDHGLMTVELHWAMTQPPYRAPDFATAWATSTIVSRQNMVFHQLSDQLTWIHLLLHAQQHIFAIKPWLDLDVARHRVHADPKVLRRYGLKRIHQVTLDVLEARPHAFPLSTLIRAYLKGILGDPRRGELVIGADSSLVAAAVLASRAATMLMLDGILYPAQALAFHVPLVASIMANKFVKPS